MPVYVGVHGDEMADLKAKATASSSFDARALHPHPHRKKRKTKSGVISLTNYRKRHMGYHLVLPTNKNSVDKYVLDKVASFVVDAWRW